MYLNQPYLSTRSVTAASPRFHRNSYSFGFVKTVIAPGAVVSFDSKNIVTIAMRMGSRWASARITKSSMCCAFNAKQLREEHLSLTRLYSLTPALCGVARCRI